MTAHDFRPPPAVSELRVFPGEPVHCPGARRLVRTALRDHTAIVDDAELVAAELFGNACRHTRSGEPGGTVGVSISALPTGLAVVSVTDEGPTRSERQAGTHSWPEVKPVTLTAPGKRGLHVVAALADGWGHTPAEESGLTVWAAFNVATLSLDRLTAHTTR